eukprot:TRINITY_DN16027_c0_g1_i1.p1 TRINITY_DN16027_c0_g1~~TRINITY_DN16027_c0_g1_i1.p1  ORF type:complete len:106 (-),score=3.32 TRINITY_DN16027_c0_g1_i1:112-429(-)
MINSIFIDVRQDSVHGWPKPQTIVHPHWKQMAKFAQHYITSKNSLHRRWERSKYTIPQGRGNPESIGLYLEMVVQVVSLQFLEENTERCSVMEKVVCDIVDHIAQ